MLFIVVDEACVGVGSLEHLQAAGLLVRDGQKQLRIVSGVADTSEQVRVTFHQPGSFKITGWIMLVARAQLFVGIGCEEIALPGKNGRSHTRSGSRHAKDDGVF